MVKREVKRQIPPFLDSNIYFLRHLGKSNNLGNFCEFSLSQAMQFSRTTKASDKDVSLSSDFYIKNFNTFVIFKMWRKIS
jgi:hypothetical protein